MPTYDYICDGCNHEFEAFESIKADPQSTCPECTEPKLRRKIGAGAAILFKGSGFYQTDYRSESYKKRAEADKQPASKPAAESSSTATSSPTPTAAKPDAAKSSSSRNGNRNGNGNGS
jgi:putative FmdB family regulatory protein